MSTCCRWLQLYRLHMRFRSLPIQVMLFVLFAMWCFRSTRTQSPYNSGINAIYAVLIVLLEKTSSYWHYHTIQPDFQGLNWVCWPASPLDGSCIMDIHEQRASERRIFTRCLLGVLLHIQILYASSFAPVHACICHVLLAIISRLSIVNIVDPVAIYPITRKPIRTLHGLQTVRWDWCLFFRKVLIR